MKPAAKPPGTALLALVLACACGSSVEVQAASEPAPQERGAPPSKEPPLPKEAREETVGERLARTLDAVRRDPTLRLIVRLDVPVASAAELSGPDGRALQKQQRDRIQAAQTAWLRALEVEDKVAEVRAFTTRPYLSLRMEADAIERLGLRSYDQASDRLSIETQEGLLFFDLEPDVPLQEHAAPGPPAPMHKVIAWTQASALHAQGHLGAGARIAVIDDGVDLAPTLAASGGGSRVVDGGSFTSHLPEPCAGGPPEPSCSGLEAGRPLLRLPTWSHGTKVATVAASAAFDTTDPYMFLPPRHSAGIAPAADILTLRVEDGNNQRWTEDVAAALESLVLDFDPDLAAVNLSLGSYPMFPGDCTPSTPLELLIHDCVADLEALGVAVVVSAGNEGTSYLGFPACLDNVITVACVNIDYTADLLSNWSPSIEIVAPGHGIVLPLGPVYGGMAVSGSSMAAPQVAGAIALLRAAYPSCSPAQIVEALLEHATSQPPFARNGISRPHLLIEDAARWLESTCAAPGGGVRAVEAGTTPGAGDGGSPGNADAGG